MNKSELIKSVSTTMSITLVQAETAVDAFVNAMTDGLSQNKRIELRGFGSFSARTYDGYVGRNPKTGSSVKVPAKVLPHFKAGKEIKNVLNK